MTRYRAFAASWLAGVTIAVILSASGRGHAAEEAAREKVSPPSFPQQVLSDPKVISTGEALWNEQCSHCHGSRAYPGKAPKLQPRRYKPEFVLDRIYNGFRGMPSWKDFYTDDEMVAIVAYILSDDFFP